MHWEELTSPNFAKAVEQTAGVCLIPIGCLERHGDHLPLGTDYVYIKYVAGKAAEIEPAIVFPPYYLSQIHEARHCPGTIALQHDMLINLLEACCNEISRNGLKKIILVNGHGGNTFFLKFFCQVMLEKPRDYVVYLYENQPMDPKVAAMVETADNAHAGEIETSRILAIAPNTVRMDQVGPNSNPLGRMAPFNKVLFSGIGWYADYPTHYAGQAEYATAEKGHTFIQDAAQKLATAIRLAKTDDTPANLQAEFFGLWRHG